jgi:hypothetical protein
MRPTGFRVSVLPRVLLIALATGLYSFGFQAPPVVTLAAYYKLDETAGTTSADSGPNNLPGTWNTTAMISTSTTDVAPFIPGNAARMTFAIPPAVQTVGGYVSVPNNAAVTFTGPFSMMAWIKPTPYNTGQNPNDTGAVIQKWDWLPSPGVLRGYAFNYNQNGTIWFNTGTSTAQDNLTTTQVVQPNTWTHVACVYDGTNKYIYINGQLSISAAASLAPEASPAPLHIGKDDWIRNYYGGVDDVRLYSGGMNAAEVQAVFAGGNTAIGVGNPGTVITSPGLLAQYYNNNAGNGTGITPPGSASATPSTTATLAFERIDPVVFFDWGNGSPNAAVNVDNFFGVWTGQVLTTNMGGLYSFGTIADDGTRIWVNGTLVLDHWVPQGPPGTPNMGTTINLNANTMYSIRVEYMEIGGGAVSKLYWQPPPLTAPVLLGCGNLYPPAGPAAPTGLTATGSTTTTNASVALSWVAPAGAPAATSYILERSTTAGGPYTQIATQTGLTFTDTTVNFGTTYYYVVQGTSENGLLVGPPSTEANAICILPPVSVMPGGPITVSETGMNQLMTLNVNTLPTSDATVTISSNNALGATVGLVGQAGTNSIQIIIPNGTPVGTQYQFMVYGVDDFIVNDPQAFIITVGVTGGGYPVTNLTVNGTCLEGDTAGIIASPSSGLLTSTAGAQATFYVTLHSKPASGPVNLSVVSSDPTEGTVSTATLNFDNTNWNQPQPVVVTGQGINITYQWTPFTVTMTGLGTSSSEYIGLQAVVSLTNAHLEVPPALPKVWGKCGLLGLEGFLPLGLLLAWRRRRKAAP